jgi:hypothetical protein
VESLFNDPVGDSYRVGGVDDDNLYPLYSNPFNMWALCLGGLVVGWGDENITAVGEAYAQEIIDLLNTHQALSEFDSGTYTLPAV